MVSAEDHIASARALISDEAYEEAEALLKSSFDEGDRRFALLIELVLCSLMLGKDSDAKRYLSLATRLDDQHSRVWCYHGFLALLSEDYPQAQRHLDRSLALDANNAEAYKWRGLCSRELGDLDRALADLNRAATLLPSDATLLINRGTVYTDLGDLARGLRDFERACLLAPEQSHPHFNAGHVLSELGRLDEARERYDRAIELDYQSTEAWLGLAGVCIQRSEWSEALRCLSAVLALDDQHTEAHFRLAQVLLELDDPTNSLAHLDLASKRAPLDPEILALKAAAHFQLGSFGRCLADCEHVLRASPDHAHAHLYRGLARLELGSSPDSGPIDDIWRAHALAPDDPTIALVLAELMLNDQQPEQACEWLTRAISASPSVIERIRRSPSLAALLQHEHVAAAISQATSSAPS